MLLDSNVLIYAAFKDSPHHERARRWLASTMNGSGTVAVPWQTIGSFLRVSTNPRIMEIPLDRHRAWALLQGWLDEPPVWIVPASGHTAEILGRLVRKHDVTANHVPDAQLAAMAIEYDLAIVSADTGFARYSEVRWINPLA